MTLKLSKVPLPPFSSTQMTQPLSHQCGGSDTSSDLVETFLTFTNCNSMSCNPNKCKELVIKKKGNSTFYPVVRNIPQHATLDLLGLTFQNDCKFFAHIKAKLCKANKCLHVLRVCRKERYSQTEIDYLFYSIVLPNMTYGLPVYGAFIAEINVLQQFLDRCYKLRFILDNYYKNKIKRSFKKLNSTITTL